ncbi:tRNA pseudouridine synthase A, putative [Phytophthora infestans T30-4]|uniref:tRNA pseudouridine synthase n=1 Tax=Phytophthora infestans (strain T30-4) TaxID=403677 RepID=D0NXD6_PHYIT|nr:tRNA pseudouridine synthase A, putative [Phytophthora infestans T30-4]EEY67733.1 tRNA pseudouridine synthase A, putative [Phytophthora infestans T30-4]|eukprot:XP_002896286.1 tRNA pseudouridine synthase A, putative [Phytophthora infestans T30-4]
MSGAVGFKHPAKLRIPRSAFLPVDVAAPWVRRRCVVEYDGAAFFGSQAQDQPGALRTVQEVIEDALFRTTGEKGLPRLRFASRTDTGVHALGQVMVFVSQCIESDRVFRDALNTRLPDDVLCHSMTTMTEAEADFDPRSDTKRKRYEYELIVGGLRPVAHRRNVWYVHKPLDVAKMQEAIDHLMTPPTTKDFSAFTPQKAVDRERGNICTISTIELHSTMMDDRGDAQYREDVATRIRLVFEGNRFRYKMVRILVGTLVDIGLGRLKPDDIPVILASQNRGKAGQGAPSQGLTLIWVKYD